MPDNLRGKLVEIYDISGSDAYLTDTVGETVLVEHKNIIFGEESFSVTDQINTNTTRISAVSAQIEDNFSTALSSIGGFDTLALFYKATSGVGPTFGGQGKTSTIITLNHVHAQNFTITEGDSDTQGVSPFACAGGTLTQTESAIRLNQGIYRVECLASFSLVGEASYTSYNTIEPTESDFYFPDFDTWSGGEPDADYDQWQAEYNEAYSAFISSLTATDQAYDGSGYIVLELFQTTPPSQTLLISNPAINTGQYSNLEFRFGGDSYVPSQTCFMFGYIVICKTAEVILRANTAGTYQIGIPAASKIPYGVGLDTFPIQLIFEKISDDVNSLQIEPILPTS